MSTHELVHGDLTEKIVGVFYGVFRELGTGFPEALYRRAMCIALEQAGIACQQEVPITVYFRGQPIGNFRLDLVAERCVVLECKVADRIVPGHRVQLLNYLTASDLSVGLVLNFGASPTFSRVVNENRRKA